jgi:hypothetical protein
MNGTSHADQNTFLIIPCPVLLEMSIVLNTAGRENRNTHFVFNNVFSKIVPFYEIMWKSIVEGGRPQVTIWRMRIACWIREATNTHSQYVIIISFPLQQWLYERISILRHTYIASVVIQGHRCFPRVSLSNQMLIKIPAPNCFCVCL